MLGSNNTISVQRRIISPTGIESWDSSYILEDEKAYVEQVSADMAISYTGQFTYDLFKIFVEKILDIKENDRIIDEGGSIYTIKGVQSFPDGEIPPHMEIVAMLKSTNEA